MHESRSMTARACRALAVATGTAVVACFSFTGRAVAQLQTLDPPPPPPPVATAPKNPYQQRTPVNCWYEANRGGNVVPAAGQPPSVESSFARLAQDFGSPTAPTNPQQFVDIANLIFSLRDAPPPDLCSNPAVQIPGPAPLDPAPILAAAVSSGCIRVADNGGAASPATSYKTRATFQCALMVAGRSWGITGLMDVDTQTAYSVNFLNLLIETPAGGGSSAMAYRMLAGNYATNGLVHDARSWTLQSVGLTDEARVAAGMGGDGRVWRWNTSFTQWPDQCPWPQAAQIARRADIVVNGTASTYFRVRITTRGGTRRQCRYRYEWLP